MSLNSGNVFSAQNLSEYMYQSLPKETSPQLKSPYDAIALLGHACMFAVGFRLIGLGESHKIEAASHISDPRPVPQEWNSSTSDDYAFRYAHDQSSLQYVLKISRLGPKAVINCLAIGDDKVRTFDLKPKDYLLESSFPFTIPPSQGENEATLSIRKTFISPGRMTDVATLYKINILQKVAPGLQKEGYEESAHAASQRREQVGASRRPEQTRGGEREEDDRARDPLRDDRLPPLAQPRPYGDPLAAEPRRPYPAGDFPPPGFEDEYEITRPRGGIGGERRPLNIGERDLYPPGLGPHDQLRGGGGLAPGGGGMHPTFDDPLFGGRGGGYSGQVPPGARYDPIGPGDGPPQGRGGPRFPGGGGGGRGGFGGGAPPNPFGGFGGNDFI